MLSDNFSDTKSFNQLSLSTSYQVLLPLMLLVFYVDLRTASKLGVQTRKRGSNFYEPENFQLTDT